jgi:hypothetical protein
LALDGLFGAKLASQLIQDPLMREIVLVLLKFSRIQPDTRAPGTSFVPNTVLVDINHTPHADPTARTGDIFVNPIQLCSPLGVSNIQLFRASNGFELLSF